MRENYTLTRLFLDADIREGEAVEIPREHVHYLGNVLRKSVGDSVRIFNGRDGEWRAEIAKLDKKGGTLTALECLREQIEVPDITLLFAPIRKHRTSFIIEKATELGVRKLQPVLTDRTQSRRFSTEKARLQAIEAAEQTERLDVPEIAEAQPLKDILAWWRHKPILFADEAGDAIRVAEAVRKMTAPAAILIGPEGGFTEEERNELRALDCVTPVTLGPRILRADTAALAILSVWQAQSGDW